MAIAGEPLAGRHLFALYSVQSVKGTAVTPAVAMGLVDWDVTSEADLRRVFGLGSPNARFLKPGIVQVPFTVNITEVQTSALILQAQRSSGVLPWLTLGFGYVDDAGTVYGWQVADCKIHSLDVSLDAGQMLQATISGVGRAITDLSAGAAAHLTPKPLMSYEALLTKGGSPHESVSFRTTLNNSVEVQPVIPGATPSTPKRGWTYQTEGNIEIGGEITRFAKSGVNLQADTLTDFALALSVVDIAGGGSPNTVSLTYADMQWGAEQFTGSRDQGFRARTPFLAKSLVIA